MSASGSRLVVLAAVAANVAIAVTKFVAAWLTGSGAMMSEGVHSLVDTGNGALLLVGMRLAARPADELHPFGHSKDLYFWTLIVAILIFGLGAGVAVYEGVSHLSHPHEIENAYVSYGVLGLALVFEAASFVVAFREFRKYQAEHGRGRSILGTIRASKDPTVFSVLLEDAAALAGLGIALGGVLLAHELGNPYADGVASILIGVVLAIVALFLIGESRGLLVGESADEGTVRAIRALAEAQPEVLRVRKLLTMQLGPREVIVNMSLIFHPGIGSANLTDALERLEDAIRAHDPSLKHVFIDVDTLRRESTADGAPAS